MLLSAIAGHGYEVMALEQWIVDPPPRAQPTLILRHDVDQDPRAALAMARIELELGLCSTWYFRWRTADRRVIGWLRERGFEIGLHYETFSRLTLQEPGFRDAGSEPYDRARSLLREEIAAFERLFGPIRSICPHGDTRAPDASNATLLRKQDPALYGIDFDANDVMRGRRLGYWLTDRSSVDGRWKDGVGPDDLFDQGITPILCLTHPNNWVAGFELWRDRATARLLPEPRADAPKGPIRTRTDAPPLTPPP